MVVLAALDDTRPSSSMASASSSVPVLCVDVNVADVIVPELLPVPFSTTSLRPLSSSSLSPPPPAPLRGVMDRSAEITSCDFGEINFSPSDAILLSPGRPAAAPVGPASIVPAGLAVLSRVSVLTTGFLAIEATSPSFAVAAAAGAGDGVSCCAGAGDFNGRVSTFDSGFEDGVASDAGDGPVVSDSFVASAATVLLLLAADTATTSKTDSALVPAAVVVAAA